MPDSKPRFKIGDQITWKEPEELGDNMNRHKLAKFTKINSTSVFTVEAFSKYDDGINGWWMRLSPPPQISPEYSTASWPEYWFNLVPSLELTLEDFILLLRSPLG